MCEWIQYMQEEPQTIYSFKLFNVMWALGGTQEEPEMSILCVWECPWKYMKPQDKLGRLPKVHSLRFGKLVFC